MRLLLTFIIFILGGFYTFGKGNCCEQCCEYLENCCKKGKGEENEKGNKEENKEEGGEEEVLEKFYLKKTKEAKSEEIKNLVNEGWYEDKKKIASFILYEKIDGVENQNLNDNNGIKVTKYKNGFSIEGNFIPEKDNNEQKWALFEIIYKEEKEEEKKEEVEDEETVYLYCSDIESSALSGIFGSCNHISISVIACDTSRVTNMSSIFYNCSSLAKLDLSKFNTKTVTNMSFIFSRCSSLKELDLSKFDTKNVTNMSSIFYNCSSLTKLNLSNFNTEKVTDMYSMFSGCEKLKNLNLSKFDTKNVTNMSSMFYNCSSLTELYLSNFNTKKVTDMSLMFFDCNSLQTVTFNENLNEGIKQRLNNLGLTEEVKEEENKITLKKKPQT